MLSSGNERRRTGAALAEDLDVRTQKDSEPLQGGLSLEGRVQKIAQAAPSPALTAHARASGRAARAPAFRPATLIYIGGEKVDAVLKNVSATGAGSTAPRPHLPERVMLVAPSRGIRSWA